MSCLSFSHPLPNKTPTFSQTKHTTSIKSGQQFKAISSRIGVPEECLRPLKKEGSVSTSSWSSFIEARLGNRSGGGGGARALILVLAIGLGPGPDLNPGPGIGFGVGIRPGAPWFRRVFQFCWDSLD